MPEPITSVPAAVAALGALPVPARNRPKALTAEREVQLHEILNSLRQDASDGVSGAVESSRALDDALTEVRRLRAELAKYVGAEPTIAEEMAYLSRCLYSVHDLCDDAEKQAGRWENPLPVPEWVARVRAAAEGLEPRRSYPPALPWAALMDDEDLEQFLADLTASVVGYDGVAALAEVEKTCGTWRAIAEAQHAHNTAPGPNAEAGEPS